MQYCNHVMIKFENMHFLISKLKQTKYLLVLILIFAFAIRVYNLAEVPPSLSWDEASIGYDAWSIVQDGKDQWGERLPLIFRSFGEYKFPFHIYTTAVFVSILGLSEYAVRLPSALFGVVNIFLIFFFARNLTGSVYIGLLSSLILAISPWHIQFSRVNWETNFALFFFFLGNLAFLKVVKRERGKILIPISYFLFGLTTYSYNAAKVFVPFYLLFLTIIYFKRLIRYKAMFILGIGGFLLIIFLTLLNPKLSGTVRFQQVDFPNDWIISTATYKLTNNRIFSRGELFIRQYYSHFSPKFLLLSGDENSRHSSQVMGQAYIFDVLFIIIGLFILSRRRTKEDLVLLVWFFMAFIPASIAKEAPHASRAMFALGSFHIVSATGLSHFFSHFRNNIQKKAFIFFAALFITVLFGRYFYLYLTSYPVRYSQDWQYGYKQIFTKYKDEFQKYDNIFISDAYAQPYIFALFYLKYDPKKFRAEAVRNSMDQWGFSTVKTFDKFIFGKVKDAEAVKGISLIFASPSEYLAKTPSKDVILNLDASPAFYVYEYAK